MHQEHTSFHFYQQEQFLEAVFFLAANAWIKIRKTAAADSDGLLCYFFLYTRNSETLWSPVSVNILNGANLNIIFCPDLFFLKP